MTENPYPKVPRRCQACGGALKITHSGKINSAGKFREKYSCDDCVETGTITGFEDHPQGWTCSGDALSAFIRGFCASVALSGCKIAIIEADND